MTVYKIRDWGRHFESSRTERLRMMTFVCIPTKHDGDGYTELLDHPDGAAHYGAWVAMLAVAAKSGVRGTLMRDDSRPHDAKSLARKTRIQACVFEAAIPRLIQIGWLEEVADCAQIAHSRDPICPEGAPSRQNRTDLCAVGTERDPNCPDGARIAHSRDPICPDGAKSGQNMVPEWNGMEWNGREGNGREEGEKSPSPPSDSGGLDSGVDQKKPKRPPPESVPIPESLDTPKFHEAWRRWLEARRARGKPVSAIAAKQQLTDLAPHGPERSVAAINKSIASDWLSLNPEGLDTHAKPGTRRPPNFGSGKVHPSDTGTKPGEL